MSDWSPNQVIQGRYRLKSLLGRGGMGSVWVAQHEQLRSEVAVKRLDPSIASNEEALARFNREAQALAALRSPNVVQVFDYGVDEGVAFIAMELLQGEALSSRIHRLGQLSIDETARFLGEVLRAIGKAHAAGVIHRDLKPDNIFICQDDPEFAKVLDFGVAKVSATSQTGIASQTRTGAVIGTPYYMSPEQARGQSIDIRTDLWSMGIIAFECLTGQLPFAGEAFGEILVAICTEDPKRPSQIANVPVGFDEWFLRAVNRDRELRFQSAREMWVELARLVGGPLSTQSTGTNSEDLPPLDRTMQVPHGLTTAQGAATYSTVGQQSTLSDSNRRQLKGLAIGLGSLLLLAGGGVAWYFGSQPADDAVAATSASAISSVSLAIESTAEPTQARVVVQPAAAPVVEPAAQPSLAVLPVAAPSVSVESAKPAAPRKRASAPARPASPRVAPRSDNVRELSRSF